MPGSATGAEATGGTSGVGGATGLAAMGGDSLGCCPLVVKGSGALLMYHTTPATAMTPEKELKDLENLIKHLKALGGNSAGGIVMADLQRQQQGVKEKVLQARPLPVRLQSAVKRR